MGRVHFTTTVVRYQISIFFFTNKPTNHCFGASVCPLWQNDGTIIVAIHDYFQINSGNSRLDFDSHRQDFLQFCFLVWSPKLFFFLSRSSNHWQVVMPPRNNNSFDLNNFLSCLFLFFDFAFQRKFLVPPPKSDAPNCTSSCLFFFLFL